MTVYTGKPDELAKTLLLYQTDEVPEWHAYYMRNDGKLVDSRIFFYDAIMDWLEAFDMNYIGKVMNYIENHEYDSAVQLLADLRINLQNARDALLAASIIDKQRKMVVGAILRADGKEASP